jgi:hypothetical protein
MSSGFGPSPRLQKGALVGLDPFNPLASIIVFQYNPESLTRTLTPGAAAERTEDQAEVLRLVGPPTEIVTAELEIDATDQLERGDASASNVGIHPTLAALEMMLYPKSALVIANEVLNQFGIVEIIPPEAPLILFVWGVKRVLPVRVNELSITEEFFDPALNPIRARVRISMRVLNYRDLGLLSPGGALFMAHQLLKEAMATVQGVSTLSGTASFSLGTGLSVSS